MWLTQNEKGGARSDAMIGAMHPTTWSGLRTRNGISRRERGVIGTRKVDVEVSPLSSS
jgi:hypothetical protein